jgi:hypothetical protein
MGTSPHAQSFATDLFVRQKLKGIAATPSDISLL